MPMDLAGSLTPFSAYRQNVFPTTTTHRDLRASIRRHERSEYPRAVDTDGVVRR
jgi:hypothetical protein